MYLIAFTELLVFITSLITYLIVRKKDGYFASAKKFWLYTLIVMLLILVIGVVCVSVLFSYFFLAPNGWWSFFP